MEPEPLGHSSNPHHAWLPAALPAFARSFRVADEGLARTLALAGARIVESGAEVEIGPLHWLRGESPSAIVPFRQPLPRHARRRVRVLQRLVRSSTSRLRAGHARRRLGRLGYARTSILTWEMNNEVRAARGGLRRPVLNAIAVGHRGEPPPTIVQHVLAEAGMPAGTAGPPLAREGSVTVLAAGGVFRVSVGPSRTLAGQAAALEALRSAPAAVAERVPMIEGRGRLGLAEWSRERRLEGAAPSPPLPETLLQECVDFLGDLFGVERGSAGVGSTAAAAAVVASVSPARSDSILALGRELETRLAALPRGFGHGDFHHGNLLARGGRLVGVIDWDAAAPGRLPLLDLLHLKAGLHQAQARVHLGPAVVEVLLPWARAGGDVHLSRLRERSGVPDDRRVLEDLVAAYWLDFVARDLEKSTDRRTRAPWLAQNVDLVADAIAPAP
ncbi:MAG: phosphotransferase [Gaiellaceae bacterium]